MATSAMDNGDQNKDEGFSLPPAQTHVEIQWKLETRPGYEEDCRRQDLVPEPCKDCSTDRHKQHYCICRIKQQLLKVTDSIEEDRKKNRAVNPHHAEQLDNLTKELDKLRDRPCKIRLNADEYCRVMNILNSHHIPEQPAPEHSCDMCEIVRCLTDSLLPPDTSSTQRSETQCNECESQCKQTCRRLGIRYDIESNERKTHEDNSTSHAAQLPSINPYGAVGEPVIRSSTDDHALRVVAEVIGSFTHDDYSSSMPSNGGQFEVIGSSTDTNTISTMPPPNGAQFEVISSSADPDAISSMPPPNGAEGEAISSVDPDAISSMPSPNGAEGETISSSTDPDAMSFMPPSNGAEDEASGSPADSDAISSMPPSNGAEGEASGSPADSDAISSMPPSNGAEGEAIRSSTDPDVMSSMPPSNGAGDEASGSPADSDAISSMPSPNGAEGEAIKSSTDPDAMSSMPPSNGAGGEASGSPADSDAISSMPPSNGAEGEAIRSSTDPDAMSSMPPSNGAGDEASGSPADSDAISSMPSPNGAEGEASGSPADSDAISSMPPINGPDGEDNGSYFGHDAMWPMPISISSIVPIWLVSEVIGRRFGHDAMIIGEVYGNLNDQLVVPSTPPPPSPLDMSQQQSRLMSVLGGSPVEANSPN